jgi:hypothetical protein
MADEQTLDEVQALITEKYLGQAGIHGVGIRRKQSAIALYVEPGATQQHENLLTQISEEAKPYNVMVVEEERPSIK